MVQSLLYFCTRILNKITMKKTTSIVMMAIAVAMFILTGCKKDNDSAGEDIALGYYVEGDYNGLVSYSVMGQMMNEIDAVVTLEKDVDNTISITLPEIVEGMLSIPEISLSEVVISTTDKVVFTIEETEINTTIDSTNYVGTLNGVVDGDNLSLEYSVKPGAMPMSIDYAFTGEKE